MKKKCYLCQQSVDIKHNQSDEIRYVCDRCGHVRLWREVAEAIPDTFKKEELNILSIINRIEWENNDRKYFIKPRELKELTEMVKNYKPLTALEKMDNALENLNKASKYVGEEISVPTYNDYPYYHCINKSELKTILKMLHEKEYIAADDANKPYKSLSIILKGYEKLDEIKKSKV
jgi:hypothetical protein